MLDFPFQHKISSVVKKIQGVYILINLKSLHVLTGSCLKKKWVYILINSLFETVSLGGYNPLVYFSDPTPPPEMEENCMEKYWNTKILGEFCTKILQHWKKCWTTTFLKNKYTVMITLKFFSTGILHYWHNVVLKTSELGNNHRKYNCA